MNKVETENAPGEAQNDLAHRPAENEASKTTLRDSGGFGAAPCSAPMLFAFDPFLFGSGLVIVVLSAVALVGLIRLYRDLGRDLKRLDGQIALNEAKINLSKANKQHNHGEDNQPNRVNS